MIGLVVLLALAALVLIGRNRRWLRALKEGRLLAAILAAVAAVGAVVSGLRGNWIATLVLVGVSAYLSHAARTRRQATAQTLATGMSLSEARSILGVSAETPQTEITAAYRRLMQRAHPDHGGTEGLASQLNAARDRLARRR